jgi:hypothetical protein
MNKLTEYERHRAYEHAQREAYLTAREVDAASDMTDEVNDHLMARANMWANVALALRRDHV